MIDASRWPGLVANDPLAGTMKPDTVKDYNVNMGLKAVADFRNPRTL